MQETQKNNKKTLSAQPYRGTRDLFPEDLAVQKYIFDTWRKVCLSYGYKEYQTPLLELADIYRAKSGEDLGGKELYTLIDAGGRELAIRPEMTPSVTRMVSRIYDSAPKPLRLFSICNYMRAERPQRGRNREFWQLNVDIFGNTSKNSDLEILILALEIMLAFNPPKDSFILYFSDRRLLDSFFNTELGLSGEKAKSLSRLMDKYEKLGKEKFEQYLEENAFEKRVFEKMVIYLESSTTDSLAVNFPFLKETPAFETVRFLEESLEKLGYGGFFAFNPAIVRGLDYYDGLVFEVFDKNPNNPRSLFGGGRYNGLADLFGSKPFPAVGFAPGDETLRLFLENWNLIPKASLEAEYFLPLLSEALSTEIFNLAQSLRDKGWAVEQGLVVQSLTSSLREADKKGFEKVIIFGEEEANENRFLIKNMKTGEQKEVKI